jgi:outer membrane protein OmpA-like peptidoglycan-associated protein
MTARARGLVVATACLLGFPPTAGAAQRSCTHLEVAKGRAPYDIFVIFFDINSAAIRADAARILDNAAVTYRPLPHCRLIVAAHTDRLGSQGHNLNLSRKRANAVLSHLRRRGIRSVARVESFGEARPLVRTKDEVAEPQNRRAEIIIAPPDQ